MTLEEKVARLEELREHEDALVVRDEVLQLSWEVIDELYTRSAFRMRLMEGAMFGDTQKETVCLVFSVMGMELEDRQQRHTLLKEWEDGHGQ